MRLTKRVTGVRFLFLFTFIAISSANANDSSFSNESFEARKHSIGSEYNANYLLNLLSQPTPGPIYTDPVYNEFLNHLKSHPPTLLTYRVLKLAAKHLEEKYKQEKDFETQGLILTEMTRLSQAGLNLSKANNHRILEEYFQNIELFIQGQSHKRALKVDQIKNQNTTTPYDLKRLRETVNAVVNRISLGVTPKGVETVNLFDTKFEGTKFEISVKFIPVKERVENVYYIAPRKERLKAFTFKILEPSIEAGEVAYLVTKTLLANDRVAGVFLDDPLRISSKLKSDSYEVFPWGKNVLLKRPSCSKLF